MMAIRRAADGPWLGPAGFSMADLQLVFSFFVERRTYHLNFQVVEGGRR